MQAFDWRKFLFHCSLLGNLGHHDHLTHEYPLKHWVSVALPKFQVKDDELSSKSV